MRSYLVLIIMSGLLFSDTVFAFAIDVGKCYSIDGPANVRDKKNGKILESLGNGVKVKVIAASNKWYQIEYSENDMASNCVFKGKIRKAWTHYRNLLPFAHSLKQLVASERVILATSMIEMHGEDSASFLGDNYKFDCAESVNDECHLVIPRPFEITVYCLNGRLQRNRILNVIFGYGGDSGSWLTDIKYARPLPQGQCVVVNGAIAPQLTMNMREHTVAKKNICNYCKEHVALLNSDENHEFECSEYVGDLNKDGVKEAMIHMKQVMGAPSSEDYELYQLSSQCKGVDLGSVYSVTMP